MEQAERKAAAASTPGGAADAVKDAQQALNVARRMRGPASERATLVRELERKLERVRSAAAAATEDHQQTEQLRMQAQHEASTRLQMTDRFSRMQLGVRSSPIEQAAPRATPAQPTSSRDRIDYERLPGAGSSIDDSRFGSALEDAWGRSYRAATGGERDIVAFTVGSFTWLWDATLTEGATENRLIGVYGRSDPQGLPRARSRIEGFPSPKRSHPIPVDRGHAAGHSLGGPDEGWNLFPQVANVNQRGRWRELENYCTNHPGTFMFMRAVYSSHSDEAAKLEYGISDQDGRLVVEYFDNL
jgi:hypothetical protein